MIRHSEIAERLMLCERLVQGIDLTNDLRHVREALHLLHRDLTSLRVAVEATPDVPAVPLLSTTEAPPRTDAPGPHVPVAERSGTAGDVPVHPPTADAAEPEPPKIQTRSVVDPLRIGRNVVEP